MKHIALALLALAACAPALEPLPEADRPFERLDALWLEPGQAGYEAQQAWGLPLPEGFAVAELPQDTFIASCEAVTPPCGARTLGFAELPNAVYLVEGMSEHLARSTILHEMGHILRRRGGHIAAEACTDGDRPTMCANVPGRTEPTQLDYDFVLGR